LKKTSEIKEAKKELYDAIGARVFGVLFLVDFLVGGTGSLFL